MKKLYLIIFIVLLLASCSFREDEEVHEKAVLPDIILEGAEYTLGQDGNSPIYINSSRMTLYSRDNRAIVENMEFVSYNDDGTISIEGSADHAEIDTENETMDLDGNVLLHQSDGDMMIKAESLYFDTGNEEITADGTVSVSSEDGSFRGMGFAADLREKIYSFKLIEEGEFII